MGRWNRQATRSRRSGNLFSCCDLHAGALGSLLLAGLERAAEERLTASIQHLVPVDRARFREVDQVEEAVGVVIVVGIIRACHRETTATDLLGILAGLLGHGVDQFEMTHDGKSPGEREQGHRNARQPEGQTGGREGAGNGPRVGFADIRSPLTDYVPKDCENTCQQCLVGCLVSRGSHHHMALRPCLTLRWDDMKPGDRRRSVVRMTALVLFILVIGSGAICFLLIYPGSPLASAMGVTVTMPGASFEGPLPALTDEQVRVRDVLQKDLAHLAGTIGERNLSLPVPYAEAARFIEGRISGAHHQVRRQSYEVKGRTCLNLVAEIPGSSRANEVVVVGAHYDSAPWTPGANDNGTGTVALLTLADLLSGFAPERTLRLVAFANEEPPHFQTDSMGSLVYAKECKQRGDEIVAMLALETMGYYRDTPNSQKYPAPFSWFYPNTGNFIAFIGNTESMPLVQDVVRSFRHHADFPSEGGAVPDRVQGAGWSDHWSFWKCGYPGVMVTDTAPFRYPHYHRPTDTPDKIDYDRLARVVVGLRDVITDLCRPAP